MAAEIRDHPFHHEADALLQSLLKRILTNNERDSRVFGVFEIVNFRPNPRQGGDLPPPCGSDHSHEGYPVGQMTKIMGATLWIIVDGIQSHFAFSADRNCYGKFVQDERLLFDKNLFPVLTSLQAWILVGMQRKRRQQVKSAIQPLVCQQSRLLTNRRG